MQRWRSYFLHRAFLWISTISSAFPSLQFRITSLMALNHWKRRRQKYSFYWCWKKWRREPREGGFRVQDYFVLCFGSGLDDAVNGGTIVLLEGSLQTNRKRISIWIAIRLWILNSIFSTNPLRPTTPIRSVRLCERLVPVLGHFCSYQAGAVFMSTR